VVRWRAHANLFFDNWLNYVYQETPYDMWNWDRWWIKGEENNMEKKTLNVSGMSCEHCVKAVTNALSAINGVKDITVSLKDGIASFSHDPARAPLDVIKAAITEEGYEVNG
jgi:copper chaperone